MFNTEIKRLMEEIGPPQIDMKIPIQELATEFIRFKLKGLAEVFETQAQVEAEVINQKLVFEISGSPFRGVFKAQIRVTSSISNRMIN